MEKSRQYLIALPNPFETVRKEERLFQEKLYQTLYESLNNNYREFKECADSTRQFDKIAACRACTNYLVAGERGSGKTFFMNNISQEQAKGYELLDVIDPTLLNETPETRSTEAFCAVLIAHLHQHVCEMLNRIPTTSPDLYFSKFREVAEALGSMQAANEDNGIDAIYTNQNALHLEQLLHEYFQIISTRYCEKRILCFRIDDIDMSFANGYYVLEAIRKYLSSPYVVTIVSGDPKLYLHLAWKKVVSALAVPENKFEDSERHGEQQAFLRNLAEQYIYKVLPRQNRLDLVSFGQFLDKHYDDIAFGIGSKQVSLENVDKFLDKLSNPGIRNAKFKNDVFLAKVQGQSQGAANGKRLRESLRLWLQFHQKLYPIYQKCLDNHPEHQDISLDLTSHDDLTVFQSFQQSVFDFFKTLSGYQELSELARINLLSIEENRSYNVSLAFKELAASTVLHIVNEGEMRTDSGTIIGRQLCLGKKEIEAIFKGPTRQEQLLATLFVTGSFLYHSRKETYYLYSGRFLEAVFSTLGYSDDWNEILSINIMYLRHPVFCVLNQHIENLEVNFSQEKTDDDDDFDFEAIRNADPYFQMHEQVRLELNELFEGYADLQKTLIKVDASLLKSIINQYMENLNAYRHHARRGDTLAAYMLRCVYMLLNAVAMHENGNALVGNIALSSDITRETLEKYSSIYHENIAPLLNNCPEQANSLFYHIYSHPLVKLILKPENLESFKNIKVFIPESMEKRNAPAPRRKKTSRTEASSSMSGMN